MTDAAELARISAQAVRRLSELRSYAISDIQDSESLHLISTSTLSTICLEAH